MGTDAELTSADPQPQEPMVSVWSSSNFDAEMEAMSVKGVLESNGVPAILVGPQVLPIFEFQVQVPEHMRAEAERLIDEARQAGPAAAAEAESATE